MLEPQAQARHVLPPLRGQDDLLLAQARDSMARLEQLAGRFAGAIRGEDEAGALRRDPPHLRSGGASAASSLGRAVPDRRPPDGYPPGVPRTDAASRVIGAPHERVWAAFVDSDAFVTWLPPAGMTAAFERFDLRTGGSYRMVLTYVDPSGGAGKATTDTDIVEASSSTSSPVCGSSRRSSSSPTTRPLPARCP